MRAYLGIIFFFWTLVRLCHGQNCPLLGPAYPAVTDLASSPALNVTKAAFDEALAQALSSGQFDNSTTSFSIQVFTTHDNKPLYEYYHTASSANGSLSGTRKVGPGTLYRIGSISKLVTVYAILSKLSDRYWNEPVTNYVPELAAASHQLIGNAVNDVQWSEVTLGALASQMGGIGRDYSFGDLSATFPSGVPGLPTLNDGEIVQCGLATGLRACTRAESMEMILRTWPVMPTYYTPIYSNMAFQILAYAAENITGQSFATLVEDELLKPLGLTRTFLKTMPNDTDAVVVQGWTDDLGDEAPAGAYVQSVADLSRMGRSILNSSLLSPQTTRKWLNPVSHTSSSSFSVGRPWEIYRLRVPVAPSSNNTRLVDVYTKNGGIGQYLSLLGLSPDHDMGISILAAGPSAGLVYDAAQTLLSAIWIQAGEHTARELARVNFAGNYTFSDNSTVEITLLPDEPGLFLSTLVSNGTDLFASVGGSLGQGATRAWLYPTTLTDGNRAAFRAVYGAVGQPASDPCLSWGGVDGLRYGGYPADLLVFGLDEDGRATTVEVPVLKKTLRRAD
ncbi:beta-lactamase/transpeptidase-like protein [Chaetomium sp. MPI-CAGE-AT-0009]|nr:beta-lactamase/transpeptidase-like protein [Chaetomium sp. MPI-CAGE-AT-0009]